MKSVISCQYNSSRSSTLYEQQPWATGLGRHRWAQLSEEEGGTGWTSPRIFSLAPWQARTSWGSSPWCFGSSLCAGQRHVDLVHIKDVLQVYRVDRVPVCWFALQVPESRRNQSQLIAWIRNLDTKPIHMNMRLHSDSLYTTYADLNIYCDELQPLELKYGLWQFRLSDRTYPLILDFRVPMLSIEVETSIAKSTVSYMLGLR